MQKSVQVKQKTKRAKREENGVIITCYTNKLVIERRAWPEPYEQGDKWRTLAKIELTANETDDLFAVLPQAMLERERARKAKKSKKESCYSADIFY